MATIINVINIVLFVLVIYWQGVMYCGLWLNVFLHLHFRARKRIGQPSSCRY